MKSTKCSQCGLVYWATDPSCKRCGLATADSSVEPPVHETQFQNQNVAPAPANGPADPAIAQMLRNIKTDAIFFYVIGGLQTLFWFAVGQLLIVDGVLNIGLSFLIYKFRSRVAAIFLLAVTVLSMISAVMMMMEGANVGGILPVVLILRFAAALRMVQSTFRLSGHVVEGPARPLPPPPPNFHPEATPPWAEANTAPQWQPSK